MLTSEAVDRIGNGTMDFIYVDARHDYCGVKEDMELYWPKLRDGGIMAVSPFSRFKTKLPHVSLSRLTVNIYKQWHILSFQGHDYVEESTWREGGQDWSLCLVS